MARIPDAGERAIPRNRADVVSIDTSMVGKGLRMVGAVAQDFVDKKAYEDDELAVNEFRRKLNDWENTNVYDLEKGAASKRGKDAFELSNTVPQDFDKFVEAEAGGSYSPRARQAIAGLALARREQLSDWTNKYVGQQRELYIDTEFKASNISSIQRAASLASDQALVEAELGTMRLRSTEHYKRKLGQTADPTVIRDLVRAEEEQFHSGVLGNLIAMDKVNEATTYFTQNSKYMSVEDMIRQRQNIDVMRSKRNVLAGVDDIISTAGPDSPAVTSPVSNIQDVVLTLESGGQRWDPDTGSILTSPKGAQGEMQVMPDTARDPGYGVVPARDNSPEELARVGRDYITAMVKEYRGDTDKALAAYNAGPAAVGRALMQAREAGDTNWLARLPEETQAYVANGRKMLNKVQSKPKIMTMADYEPMLRARFQDPDELSRARQELSLRLQTRDNDIKVKREQAQEEAIDMVDRGVQVDALPMELRERLDPNALPGLRSYAKTKLSGQDVATDMNLYYDLATDPARLRGANLKAYRDRLGEAEFKELTRSQIALNADSREWTNILTRKEVVEGLMSQAGIETESKAGKERVAQMLSRLSQRVNNQSTEQELRAEAARMLVDVKVERNNWFNKDAKVYTLGDDEYARIIVPSEDRKRIVAGLRNNGEPVTEEAIRTWYLQGLNQ